MSPVARPLTPVAPRSGCPVSVALEILGDRWSLLVIRDLMVRGLETFTEFQRSGEGIATNILADRLHRLEAAGIVCRERRRVDGRRVHYRLTEKGIDLAPVLLELLLWSARHERTAAPEAVVAQVARDRELFLDEARRRWRDRDATPLLPRFAAAPSDQRRTQGRASTARGTQGGRRATAQRRDG